MATDATTPVLPPPAGQTSNFVNPEYRGQTFVVTSCVFLAVAVCSLILRVWTRVFIVRSIWIDDYLMIVALVLSCVLIGVTLDMTNWGLGEHMWDVPMDHFSPNFEQRNLAAAAIYCAATGFTKCSVLVFYTRIFPSRNFHRLVWALVTIAAGYSFASVLANVFSCNPIAMSWDSRITKGTCMNRPVFYFANAGLGIFTDFATVMVPVPWLRRLQMPLRQKIAVGTILMTGCSVGIVSCIRLSSLVPLMNSADLTWNTTNALMWCNIELNLGITGGCVTALRPFVRRYFPRILGSSKGDHSRSKSKKSGYPLGSLPRSDQRNYSELEPEIEHASATRRGDDNGSEDYILPPDHAQVKEPAGIIRTLEFDVESSSARRA